MPQDSYIAVEGQNLIDIALAAYGNAESVIKLMTDNSITDMAYIVRSGEEFVIDSITNPTASHLNKMAIKPATRPDNMEGIEYWAIEENFIVQ
jgi:hypothetical protein